MKTAITSILLLIALYGCQFSKSIKKDLISGLLTTGDGISCEDVYLTVNGEKTERTTFIYGEQFLVNFNNIEGLIKENDYVFPGMSLVVMSKAGDTLLKTNDLYIDYSNGIKITPLLLTSDLTVAAPINSNGEYTLNVNIWDKKGKGNFSAKLDFKVTANEKIITEAVNVTCDEIYIYSKERSKVLPDNKIKFNENTYFIFEGLSGFKVVNGIVFPGLSLKGTDKEGALILDYDDLFTDYNESGFPVSDFNSRVAPNFILTGSEFKNPLHCELTIWDKKSDARIKISADLVIEP